MIDYTLIRSQRKTVAIYVRGDGVEVRAPLKTPKGSIDKFVAAKEDWIYDRLARLREQATRREAFTLDYGSVVCYRGADYPIIAKPGRRAGFDGTAFYLPPGLPPEQIKTACIRIYRLLAKHNLTERTLAWAGRMGAAPAGVRINGAHSRWGSCSARKSINYSWRLIMAEDALIDYVVVHELAHLTELNHSERFWDVVEDVLPDYRQRRAGLREWQKRLVLENWRVSQ